MPAARNGDFLTQVLIAVWLGVSHWSKPSPRKLPGVTGLVAAVAGARSEGTATRPPRPVASRVTTIVEDREKRRSIEIPHGNCRKTALTKPQLSHQ